MLANLESGDVESVDDSDFRWDRLVHEDFGTICAAIEQDAKYGNRGRYVHAFADSFEYAFIVLVFKKTLKYVVACQYDSRGMNTEPTANDLKGTLRCWVGRALYHCNRGPLYQIGNVSCVHD